ATACLDRQPSGRQATIPEPLRNPLVRALVLLPGPDVGPVAERPAGNLLPCPTFLERRAHIECFALRGQEHREQPFADAPLDPAEVHKGGPASQHERVDSVLTHEPAPFFDPPPPPS